MKECLQVRLSRRASMQARVGEDEGEVLSLFRRVDGANAGGAQHVPSRIHRPAQSGVDSPERLAEPIHRVIMLRRVRRLFETRHELVQLWLIKVEGDERTSHSCLSKDFVQRVGRLDVCEQHVALTERHVNRSG